jgi:ribose transport system substrate-binding protein
MLPGNTAIRRHLTPLVLAACAAGLIATSAPSAAQSGPPGITMPRILPPFDPAAATCQPPPGLDRLLAFSQDTRREFMQGVDQGLAAAAKDRNLQYRLLVADSDAGRQAEHVRSLVAARAGGVVASAVDSTSLAPRLQEVIWSGGYVSTVVAPPATSLLNAPQYLTGKVLGDAASAYIKQTLGGKAKVVLLTQDSLEFLAPRFVALRDSLRDIPGANIVADISPNPVSKDGGFATMRTILLANPDVDVVLGADNVVLGALAALRAAGKTRANQFLGGIDGEPEAVSEIKKGNSPYRISVSLASPVFGYAMGQHAADWLEGKSIPQAMDILPSSLTAANIAQYEVDLANPGRVYADPVRRAAYLKMYGNICYDSRDQYLNFPWSSERK